MVFLPSSLVLINEPYNLSHKKGPIVDQVNIVTAFYYFHLDFREVANNFR